MHHIYHDVVSVRFIKKELWERYISKDSFPQPFCKGVWGFNPKILKVYFAVGRF
jgi:hypothetical protein